MVVSVVMNIKLLSAAFPDPTPKQSFNSVQEALQTYGDEVKRLNDIDYDVWLPYDIVFQQEFDDKIIVFYSYYYDDSEAQESKSPDYMVEEFKKNSDGSISFYDFATFYWPEDESDLPFLSGRCFVNVNINGEKKIVEYYYLPIDSEQNVYVDGIKAEKMAIKDGEKEFNLCYIIRDRKSLMGELWDLIFGKFKVKVTE